MGGTTAKVQAVTGSFISPGIGILKSWQGIVELSVRGVIIFLAFCLIIAGSVNQDALRDVDTLSGDENIPNADVPLTSSAAGWLIFCGVILMFYELAFIILRFLNVKILNSHIIIVIIVDVIVHAVLAVSVLAGAAAMAAYASEWESVLDTLGDTDPRRDAVPKTITSTEAVAVFGFFLLIILVAFAVFMALAAFLFKWNPTLAKYSASSSAASAGE